MKEYIIAIDNKEESIIVQGKLFSVGFHWGCSDRKVQLTCRQFLKLNSCDDLGCITYVSRPSYAFDIIKEGAIVITANMLTDDFMSTMDGATSPIKAKEMTVAEIVKELGYDVNIVK